MTKRGRKLSERYIVFEDKELDFTYYEVDRFYKLYDAGLDLPDMARRMKRSVAEILLLYLDQVEKEAIEEPKFILTKI